MWAKEMKKDVLTLRGWYSNLLELNKPFLIVDEDFLDVVRIGKLVGVDVAIPRDKYHIPDFSSIMSSIEEIGKEKVKEVEDFNLYKKPPPRKQKESTQGTLTNL